MLPLNMSRGEIRFKFKEHDIFGHKVTFKSSGVTFVSFLSQRISYENTLIGTRRKFRLSQVRKWAYAMLSKASGIDRIRNHG